MQKTKVGLPNTCHKCAVELTEYWYATCDEAAVSGGGKCGVCSGMEEKRANAERTNAERTNAEAQAERAVDAALRPRVSTQRPRK